MFSFLVNQRREDSKGAPFEKRKRGLKRRENGGRATLYLMLTILRGAALRLTGKHWDRGLTVAQRHAVAVRTLEDQEEELAALAVVAASGERGSAGVVVQAYPVG